MATKATKDIIDDDGNLIAPPPPDSPVAQIVWLLEYARKREFQIGAIQIGDTIVQVRDLRQNAAPQQGRVVDLDPDSDMAKILMPDA